jgi:general secretion pathway protein H
MTSTTGPRAERHRAGGFTLIELILVLVLISTVLALAAPSLQRFARGRETSDAAAHLLALTYLARSQAAAEARPWRLNIDPEGGCYWLSAQQGGAFVAPLNTLGRVFRFPGDVTVSVEGAEMDDAVSYIQFYPDGRSDAATIELREADGRALALASRSAAERYQIVSLTGEDLP